MGYYTYYTLKWEPFDGEERHEPQCAHAIPDGAAFCPTCGEKIRNVPYSEAIQQYMEERDNFSYCIIGGEQGKWYSHKDDMRALSAKFPAYLFTLHGEGEEGGDLWNEYYLGGKVQVAKAVIAYPPFDESQLK